MIYSNIDVQRMYLEAWKQVQRDFPEAAGDELELCNNTLVQVEVLRKMQTKIGQIAELEREVRYSGGVTTDKVNQIPLLIADIHQLEDVSLEAGKHIADICRHLGTDLE